jgi:DHA2 family multidrug resistance protein-like MFS transporter
MNTRADRAGRRDWTALAVLMLPVFVIAVDNTVLHLALPQIARDLAPSASQQLWIIDVYPLVLAGLLLIMGSLGDRIGRRRLLLIGSAGFSVVSVLAAFAPSAETLIAARVALGFFGATLMPSTLALLRTMFRDGRQRSLAIAVWAATFSAGAAFGPIIGGLLLDATGWWGSVFVLAVPPLVVLLLAAPALIDESADPAPGRLDVGSAALTITAMAPLALAIKWLAGHGPSTMVLVLLAMSIVSGALFVQRQRDLADPMIDLTLLRRPVFATSVAVNALSMMALVGFNLFASQHLQLVEGLAPAAAALVQLPGAVAAVVAGLGVVVVARRVGARAAVTATVLVTMSGYLLTALSGGTPSPALLVVAFVAVGIGVGSAETVTNDLIISSAPPERAGAASAISEVAYEVGSVLGTAVIGGVLAAAYRTHLVVPAGVPSEAADASAETLGGAAHQAELLAPAQGEALLTAARTAFESGVGITAGLGAGLMAVAAVIAWRGLRSAGAPAYEAAADAAAREQRAGVR